jgi:hypothetical protein
MTFVSGCFKTINLSNTEDEIQAAINLLGSATLKRDSGYLLEDRSILQYGPVRTTFTIQLASFFGVISPKHGSYSEIEKGKSGYYRCVNQHLEGSTGHPLTTSEASAAVDQVLFDLLATGQHVDKAVVDQVCCHWH